MSTKLIHALIRTYFQWLAQEGKSSTKVQVRLAY
jgi:hypothetical protein